MPTHYENLKPVEPKRGIPILWWFRKFRAWAESLPVIVGPNVRVTRTALGMKAVVRSSNPVRTPFRVGRRGTSIRISPGTVDGEVPWIGLDRSGLRGNVRLNGEREGDLPAVPISAVAYELNDEDGPGEDGRSFIAIAAHLDRMRQLDLASPGASAETLRIEHQPDLGPVFRDSARKATGAVYHTLAVIYWNRESGAIERIGQVCHHNLQLLEDADGVGFFVGT